MRRLTSLFVVLAALTWVPAAAATKPRLYHVSLTGKAKSELTRVKTVNPPYYGCNGTVTRTDHFVASANLSPAPNAVPLRHYGRLPFYARLTSPTATYTTKTEGGWSVDPTDPYAPDPSMCAFTPESKTLDCEYNPISTRRLGGPFTLGLPDNGSYRLYYSLSNGTVRCPEGEIGARLLEAEAYGPPTKLRVGAVKGLRKGRRVSVSGTVDTVPGSPGVTGGETLDYTLNVKRLR